MKIFLYLKKKMNYKLNMKNILIFEEGEEGNKNENYLEKNEDKNKKSFVEEIKKGKENNIIKEKKEGNTNQNYLNDKITNNSNMINKDGKNFELENNKKAINSNIIKEEIGNIKIESNKNKKIKSKEKEIEKE